MSNSLSSFLPKIAALVLAGAAIVVFTASAAQGIAPSIVSPKISGWKQLSPTQQKLLAPLEADWDQLGSNRQSKWVEIANKMPSMSAPERERIQRRMRAWALMTPAERAQARESFREIKKKPPETRQRAWDEYQQLPKDERERLAAEARARASALPPPDRTGKRQIRPPTVRAPLAAPGSPAKPIDPPPPAPPAPGSSAAPEQSSRVAFNLGADRRTSNSLG